MEADMVSFRVRPMIPSDTGFALSLTRMEGWSDISSDFERLITYTPAAAFIAEVADRPVSMVSAVSYGRIGFIGCLITLPEFRNRGLGSHLMEYVIDHLERKGSESIMLDAVPRALPVYERLGFRQICFSRRFYGSPASGSFRGVKPIEKNQMEPVLRIDTQQFSGDRSHFLTSLWHECREACLALEKDRNIAGYSFASPRGEIVRLGPLYAKEDYAAEALVAATTANYPGCELRLGVLDANQRAVEMAKRMGFEESMSSVRMLRGDRERVVLSDHLYAIGSPAKG